ncbi:MAG TPA: Fe-S cluster assembly protein SufD [Candidatus Binatia bacterium]|nr:Fe-S cluster assembly protein SufD [Candidatus Binatia bacterium]
MFDTQGTEPYLSAFRSYQANGAGRGPAWLKELRESAIASFGKLGFPTTRDEGWKYTNVEPIVSTIFERGSGIAKDSRAVSAAEVFALSFTDPIVNRLVFVNGAYAPELSLLRGLRGGARVESLAEALRAGDEILHDHLSRYVRYRDRSFAALNTAFVEDGALVLVPKGQVIEEPIQLVFVSLGEARPIVTHPRNLIVVGEGSQTRIVESHIGIGSGPYFANAVTEIVGGEGASIEHCLVQREGEAGFHVGTLEAQLSRQSTLVAHCVTLAGLLVRNDVRVVLNGEGAECSLNGLYLLDGKQHVDNHTEIEHCMPRAKSLELYKGILSGRARGVFDGKILVHKNAQKSDARQTNKNLLLSEGAVVNTKPQLEIYADDVKCSHGSTVGQLDRDSLFYLRSRGIDVTTAQSLLNYAFASDVISAIKIASLRERLNDYLLTQFGSAQYPSYP